ncbi:MAG: ParB/RepB/Spo0J family partition protein [Planctomycetaceae bacterium]|nr:ParB/RepB/Spo0J family partition protein [Planctomycetota bacterium]NUN52054.1 ParB/RepB/Spo0J family partition protein [Planctomycetaceae bacterium]
MVEKRLGRGLDFLISRTTVPAAGPGAGGGGLPDATPVAAPEPPGPRILPLESIAPNPFQPRKEFEPGALADLESSIREHGVLQPIVVRPVGGAFQLVAGERRLRASKNVGLAGIPAVVRDVTDSQMLTLALVENIQRENLNPMETARAYRDLLATPDLTQEDVARLVGKSRVSIANTVRLLDLPEGLQEQVSRGTLTAGHGRALLMCPDAVAMEALATRIIGEGLSVREAEALASSGVLQAPSPNLRPVGQKRERSSHLDELEARLRTSLGTRVVVKPGRGKRGKVVIHYASLEEFDRLYEILTGAEPTLITAKEIPA